MKDAFTCRIAVFYDGYYFTIGCKRMYPDFGWLQFKPFHRLLETCIAEKEPEYARHHVVYAAWVQGIYASHQTDEKQLKDDRRLHHDLMHAGIEMKLMPMSQSGSKEKGADVALAVDCLQLALEGKIDVAVLVTGDGDFVPLARALKRHGVRVLVAHFDRLCSDHEDFANPRLLDACNYSLRINDLGKGEDHDPLFKGPFSRPEGYSSEPTPVSAAESTSVAASGAAQSCT